jgi:hypothetical protein
MENYSRNYRIGINKPIMSSFAFTRPLITQESIVTNGLPVYGSRERITAGSNVTKKITSAVLFGINFNSALRYFGKPEKWNRSRPFEEQFHRWVITSLKPMLVNESHCSSIISTNIKYNFHLLTHEIIAAWGLAISEVPVQHDFLPDEFSKELVVINSNLAFETPSTETIRPEWLALVQKSVMEY